HVLYFPLSVCCDHLDRPILDGDLDSSEILSFETLLGRGVSSFARDAVQDLTYRLAMLKPTANRSSTPQKRNLGRRLPGLSVNLLSSCTWRVLPRENSRGFRFIGRIVETSDTTFLPELIQA